MECKIDIVIFSVSVVSNGSTGNKIIQKNYKINYYKVNIKIHYKFANRTFVAL